MTRRPRGLLDGAKDAGRLDDRGAVPHRSGTQCKAVEGPFFPDGDTGGVVWG